MVRGTTNGDEPLPYAYQTQNMNNNNYYYIYIKTRPRSFLVWLFNSTRESATYAFYVGVSPNRNSHRRSRFATPTATFRSSESSTYGTPPDQLLLSATVALVVLIYILFLFFIFYFLFQKILLNCANLSTKLNFLHN